MTEAQDIYCKYITISKKGETVLYVKELNVIYRIIKAGLIFYKKFVGNLTTIGFKKNPNDPCVAKKRYSTASKMTDVWHVDDINISNKSKNIVTMMYKWQNKTYEILFEDGSGKINISKGNIHEYLATAVDFSYPGEININMIPCIKEIVK